MNKTLQTTKFKTFTFYQLQTWQMGRQLLSMSHQHVKQKGNETVRGRPFTVSLFIWIPRHGYHTFDWNVL